ncbi:hypothetical protein PILCRDRAFT_4707 [Piloderma croceum F 1598]|uniref:Uncharacterized protein n=1 Tax=Piloderma croceum (strain F 1598) TaxID=765440 RepID=A0A0C3G4S3_PILCF|nr:hypothetical protein PILCRDRAFT_4707 [Piloderma croceum F 1598]
MATGEMNDTVGRQQVQDDQKPTSHKQKRAERQEGRGGVTADAIRVRDEDKRGSGDRGKGSTEQQFQAQQALVDDRQKHISDAQEQRDRYIKDMERDIGRQQGQITRLKQEMVSLREEGMRNEDRLTRSEREKSKLQHEIRDLRDRLEQSQRHEHGQQQQLQRQEQENKILQTESHQLKAQYAHTAALLETRTSELKGAQAFLTKADSISGAEVTSMVEGLNSEILQTAAFMADSFEFVGTLPSATMERNEACERVEHMLGKRMSTMLSSVQHSEDPMLVQIALQSCLIRQCVLFIRVWSLEESLRANQLLETIYTRLGQAEDQTVSGRWRALTHRHARTLPHDDPTQTSSAEMAVVNDLVDILIIAGYRRHHQEGFEMVSRKFGDKIKAINKASFRLNQVLKEEIISSDLEPVWVSPNISFDPAGMEDFGGEQVRQQQSDRVLCITEMGLQRVVRQIKENRSRPETTLLLKPKVALESVTDSMSKRGMTVAAWPSQGPGHPGK